MRSVLSIGFIQGFYVGLPLNYFFYSTHHCIWPGLFLLHSFNLWFLYQPSHNQTQSLFTSFYAAAVALHWSCRCWISLNTIFDPCWKLEKKTISHLILVLWSMKGTIYYPSFEKGHFLAGNWKYTPRATAKHGWTLLPTRNDWGWWLCR